jgi:hypothetical protein
LRGGARYNCGSRGRENRKTGQKGLDEETLVYCIRQVNPRGDSPVGGGRIALFQLFFLIEDAATSDFTNGAQRGQSEQDRNEQQRWYDEEKFFLGHGGNPIF